jgi:hypothetical protein
MATTPHAAVPLAPTLGQAIDASPNLTSLAQRLAQSQARWAAVRASVPQAMHDAVWPGPLDAEGWTLLVANASIAAKMRHLVPRLAVDLRDHGWPELPIRIRVRSP